MQNPSTRKCTSNLKKYRKKKKYMSGFLTLSIDDMKTKEKTQTCLVGIKILNNFFSEISGILRIYFLMETWQWLLLTYDKSSLVLVIISFV